MMKTGKRWLQFVLAFALISTLNVLLCTFGEGIWENENVVYADTSVSGTCGENLSWELTDGVLTISGTGRMDEWSQTSSPWYSKCTSINEIVVESGVTSIGSYAFYNCSNLKEITLCEGLDEIGKHAFEKCKNLAEISFPETLTYIGEWAFYECNALENITFPGSVEYFGDYSFGCCEGLMSIIFSEGIKKIGPAFNNCTGLKTVSFPDSLISIAAGAFAYCTSLDDIVFPDNITSIGATAFMGCSSLSSITLPKNLVSLGQSAFFCCSGLSSVIFPDGFLTIGATSFYGCTNLVSLTLPDSIVLIDEGAFYDCDSLSNIYYSGSLENWNMINIEENNDSISGALIHCSDGVIAADLSDYNVSLSSNSYIYDGTEKKPSARVTRGNVCLTEGIDYIIDYSDNINAGTAHITITGTGNYIGTIETEFYIAYLFLDECTIELSYYSAVYDGQPKTPTVTLKIGTVILTKDVDYTVSYAENVGAGEANVTAEGIGNCIGSIWDEFYIEKASQTITVSADSASVDVGSTFSITASASSGEQVFYESSDTDVATVSRNGVVTGMASGTVEITVIAAETENYYAATEKITVTVNKISLSGCEASLVTSSCVYDGAVKTPAVTVKTADGTTLTKERDYTVAYTNNINPGTATVTITGIGDYEGTITVTFEIKLATCSVSYINNTMYGLKVVWGKVTGASGYYIYIRNDDGTYNSTPTATVEGGDTTEWTDTRELTGGRDYTYKVAAYYENSDGTITVGSTGTTKTCKYLKWGVVESVTNTTSGLKVTWTKVAGANGYYIFCKAAGESDYTQVATVTGSSKVSWTDTSSLTSGKNYTYKVSAIFTNSKGQVTKGGAKTTKTAKYLTAGKISSLSNTANGVYIKWSKVTGATGYYVYRKSSSGSYTLVKTITSVGTTTYSDTAVKSSNNTTYTYYVQPYFKSSAGVITKAAYTTKTIVRLVAPTISSLTNSASKTMTVKWGTKSGVTDYQVQYSANSSFSSGNKTLTVTGASSSSKVISGLTKGKTYYVRIRTYKTVNGTTYYSAWCTVKSVKISK